MLYNHIVQKILIVCQLRPPCSNFIVFPLKFHYNFIVFPWIFFLYHEQLELRFYFLTTCTQFDWNYTGWQAIQEHIHSERKKRWAENIPVPHELNQFFFVFCLWGHHDVTDTSSMGASPGDSLLLFDRPTELVCGTLEALFVLSLSNLILSLAWGHCGFLNKHAEHWNQARRNKAVFKGRYPTQRQNPACLIHGLISEWG